MYAKRLAVLGLGIVVSLGGCVTSRVVHRTHGKRHRDTRVVLLERRIPPRPINKAHQERHRDAKPQNRKVETERAKQERPKAQSRPRHAQNHKATEPQTNKRSKPQSREQKGKTRKDKRTKPTKKDTEANRREEKGKAGRGEGIAKPKTRNDKRGALELKRGRLGINRR